MSCICTKHTYTKQDSQKQSAISEKKDPDIKTHAKETITYIHTQLSDTHGFTHAWGPDTKEFHPFKHRNKYP